MRLLSTDPGPTTCGVVVLDCDADILPRLRWSDPAILIDHVIAAVHWSFNFPQPFDVNFRDGSCFVSWISKNGDTPTSPRDATAVDAPAVHGQFTTQLIVMETALAADDYLELNVLWREISTGIPLSQLKFEAWLTVRRLCVAD